MKREATISDCGLFRYTLTRTWDDHKKSVCFVLLNPSTADAELDDHTLRKGVGFAERWGYGSLVFVNLFAFRATKPKDMKGALDPIGPGNDTVIRAHAQIADMVVLAWGTNGAHQGRDKAVIELLQERSGEKLHCLGKTKAGHPRHPLTLAYTTPLEKWS